MMPDQYNTWTENFIVYTGDEQMESIESKTLLVTPAHIKWVKKTGSGEWIEKAMPEESKTIQVLRDTTTNKEFIVKEITYFEFVAKGGNIDWSEVICNNQVTNSFILDLHIALKERGYYEGELKKEISPDLKKSLTNFQSANALPSGQIDTNTLIALGLKEPDKTKEIEKLKREQKAAKLAAKMKKKKLKKLKKSKL